jgi:hypothetical protein
LGCNGLYPVRQEVNSAAKAAIQAGHFGGVDGFNDFSELANSNVAGNCVG